ncbi:hypothetical protein A7978_04565 (plasmid) [Borrelia turicatae]|uniref:Lipoprotein n=3 Tax=Borrelia turicatae TaxID=142 RepID=T1ECK6_BORT9|nr:CRASP family complement regulator-acquiring lipoprotein [Borrelia turicatae]ADN26470.1 hypothetical protein BTA041 [Borrelia turicatae 91E135]ANF34387.1 hypothetical protein A7978_04565 [Borrelia turicatae]UPA13971.1 hypothetical protein bt91E135_001133 [Borrelia turicatae 91E135]UPA15464.1 hypothetical protein btBTE5EL_001144 [Borrelia turicatae]
MKKVFMVLCTIGILGLIMGCLAGGKAIGGQNQKVRVNIGVSSSIHVDGLLEPLIGQIYKKLKSRVKGYRKEFRACQFKFEQGQHQFSIPVFDKLVKFGTDEKRDMIYATLGYDVDLIKKLETMMSKITLKEAYESGLASHVIVELVNRLYDITYYFKSVLVDHLNDVSLEQLSLIKSREELTELYNALERLSNLRTNVMSQIRTAIESAMNFEYNKTAMLTELKEIVDSKKSVSQLSLEIMQIGHKIQYFVDGKDEEIDERDLY